MTDYNQHQIVSPVSPLEDMRDPPSLTKLITINPAEERRSRIAEHAPQLWIENDQRYAPQVVNQQQDYGMHVVYGREADAPESNEIGSPLYTVPTEFPNPMIESATPKTFDSMDLDKRGSAKSIIFGLRKRTFWILVVIGIILILGAIGGGVGGAMVGRNRNAKIVAASVSTPSTTPLQASSTSSSSVSTGTTSSTMSTVTWAPSQMPAFSLQTYEFGNLTGRTQIIYTVGYFRLGFKAEAYTWIPGAWTTGMAGCSMAFCYTDQELGWWGGADRTGTVNSGLWSADYGDSVVIACASTYGDPGCLAPLNTASILTVPIIDSVSATTTSRSTGSKSGATALATKTSSSSGGTSGVPATTGKGSSVTQTQSTPTTLSTSLA